MKETIITYSALVANRRSEVLRLLQSGVNRSDARCILSVRASTLDDDIHVLRRRGEIIPDSIRATRATPIILPAGAFVAKRRREVFRRLLEHQSRATICSDMCIKYQTIVDDIAWIRRSGRVVPTEKATKRVYPKRSSAAKDAMPGVLKALSGGHKPHQLVADSLGITVRTVMRAIAALKQAGHQMPNGRRDRFIKGIQK